jgi:hypothetical protein
MNYENLAPRGRAELEAMMKSGDAAVVATAVLSAALHETDRAYAERLIMESLQHQDAWVRGSAAIAASHIARVHRALSVNTIVPMIEKLLLAPHTKGKALDALDDIQLYLKQAI